VIRFVVRTLVSLAGNAIGLIIAAIVLDDMSIDVLSFVVAVVIFTVVLALTRPFIEAQLRRRGPRALGGVSLIATFIALVITDLLSSGLSISGIVTWLAATVIVWAGALIAVFVLPFLGLRKYMEERRSDER
jgi:uncharacterized membrane protein YvlD (DUF360 family)